MANIVPVPIIALAKGELFVEAHYASSFFRMICGVEQFSVPGMLVATDLAQPCLVCAEWLV